MDGERGVSNIATVIVYLLAMVKGIIEFITLKRGGVLLSLFILLNPINVIKTISLSITAIQEIFKALPEAYRESTDLSSNELRTISTLVLLGLQNVNSE